jgi:hypothetical protein
VYNHGTLEIVRNTLSKNGNPHYGGRNTIDDTSTITDSTISGNSLFCGGGISDFDTGIVTLDNSTI